MNWLDIVIGLLLVWAVWDGWRQGVVTQILGLAAFALGIFLAWRYGGAIGAWLGLEELMARVVGFAIVLAVVVLAVVLIGHLTRGLFRIVGLGAFDSILGALFSIVKMALFVGLVMIIFETLDPSGRAISPAVKEGSVLFGAVDAVCDVVFPFVRDLFRQL